MTAIRDRLLSNVEIVGECWQWQGKPNLNGYGEINYEGRTQRAHRVSYVAFKGEVPAGLQVDHTCHSNDTTCAGGPKCPHRACINPDHLEAVTAAVNAQRGRNCKRAAA